MDHKRHNENHSEFSEVKVEANYHNGYITVQVTDDEGKIVELEKTHEKQMHLIIVSKDLETFLHVHPNELKSGHFEIETELRPDQYFAFVDINPKCKTYWIEPIKISVDNDSGYQSVNVSELSNDSKLTKEINGKKVTLSHSDLNFGKTVTLAFDVNGEKPLPYLGALGHVVIIDKQVEKFIHVHPLSDDVTEFQAHFPRPGIYKLWAEFNLTDIGVMVFSFVLEVD